VGSIITILDVISTLCFVVAVLIILFRRKPDTRVLYALFRDRYIYDSWRKLYRYSFVIFIVARVVVIVYENL
jgi:hypothetical protein